MCSSRSESERRVRSAQSEMNREMQREMSREMRREMRRETRRRQVVGSPRWLRIHGERRSKKRAPWYFSSRHAKQRKSPARQPCLLPVPSLTFFSRLFVRWGFCFACGEGRELKGK